METLTLDPALAENASKVFKKAGLSLKEAVDMFLKETVRKNELPLEREEKEEYSSNIKALRKAQASFEGCAEEWGFKSEEDIVKYIKDLRADYYEEWKKTRNA